MADGFGNFLSGAASGAAASSTLGPWGIAGGALIGGLSGLFGARKEAPKYQYQNPYQHQIDYNIDELQRSDLGRKAAGSAAGEIRGSAMDAYEAFSANPAFAGNAAVQAAAYGDIMRQSEKGISSAWNQGAQTDLAAHAQGTQLAQQEASRQGNMDFAAYQLQQEQNARPSTMEQLLLTAGSYGLGKLLGGQNTPADEPALPEAPPIDTAGFQPPVPSAPIQGDILGQMGMQDNPRQTANPPIVPSSPDYPDIVPGNIIGGYGGMVPRGDMSPFVTPPFNPPRQTDNPFLNFSPPQFQPYQGAPFSWGGRQPAWY